MAILKVLIAALAFGLSAPLSKRLLDVSWLPATGVLLPRALGLERLLG